MTNVHLLPIEMDGGDQAVLVAADVEHDVSPNFICTGERLAQFIKAMKSVCCEYPKPSIQCSFAIWMLPREFSQGLTRDNVHKIILPQTVAFDKCFLPDPFLQSATLPAKKTIHQASPKVKPTNPKKNRCRERGPIRIKLRKNEQKTLANQFHRGIKCPGYGATPHKWG